MKGLDQFRVIRSLGITNQGFDFNILWTVAMMKELTNIKRLAYPGTQGLFLNQTDVVGCLLQYGLELLVVLLSQSLEKPLHLFNIMLLFSLGNHLINNGSEMFKW